jgi:hypothetical protein
MAYCPPELEQTSAENLIRVFTSVTNTKMDGNNAFGIHCGQFLVDRGIGILSVKKDVMCTRRSTPFV